MPQLIRTVEIVILVLLKPKVPIVTKYGLKSVIPIICS